MLSRRLAWVFVAVGALPAGAAHGEAEPAPAEGLEESSSGRAGS